MRHAGAPAAFASAMRISTVVGGVWGVCFGVMVAGCSGSSDPPEPDASGTVVDGALQVDGSADAQPNPDSAVDGRLQIDSAVDARLVDAAVDARVLDGSADAAVDARVLDGSADAARDAAVDASAADGAIRAEVIVRRVGVSALTTTESGGTAQFKVKLSRQPTALVSVGLTSSDLTEGTVAPVALLFNGTNWSQEQTATIVGVDDALADGTQSYRVLFAVNSTDLSYHALPVDTLSVSNVDNEPSNAGIVVTPTFGLMTSESGTKARFTVALRSRPASVVALAINSSNKNEIVTSRTLIPFTPLTFAQPVTVELSGVDDNATDGAQNVTIEVLVGSTSDPDYQAVPPVTFTAVNADND